MIQGFRSKVDVITCCAVSASSFYVGLFCMTDIFVILGVYVIFPP